MLMQPGEAPDGPRRAKGLAAKGLRMHITCAGLVDALARMPTQPQRFAQLQAISSAAVQEECML